MLRWNSTSAPRGVVAEDAVLAAGVEAERVQPALELGDVVAAQHRAAAVEEPVAEREAALDQRGPGLGPQMPSTRSPRAVLERARPRPRSRRRTCRLVGATS